MGPEPKDYQERLKTVIQDINRDGRADVLWNDKDGLKNDLYVGLAKVVQGDGNIFSFETAKQTHPDQNVDWDSFENPVMADVNGDLKPDVIWIRPQQSMGIYVALAY